MFERAGRIKARRIAAHADVNLFAILNGPGKITRRQHRIEETMKPRRTLGRDSFQNFFQTDNPLSILFQTQRPGDR